MQTPRIAASQGACAATGGPTGAGRSSAALGAGKLLLAPVPSLDDAILDSPVFEDVAATSTLPSSLRVTSSTSAALLCPRVPAVASTARPAPSTRPVLCGAHS